MDNFNDRKNVVGMAAILADDDEEDMDLDAIEKSITEGIDLNAKKEDNVDLAQEYAKELDQLTKRFNIPTNVFEKPSQDISSSRFDFSLDQPKTEYKPSTSYSMDFNQVEEEEEEEEAPPISRDPQFNYMTNEERKQQQINRVLDDIDPMTEEDRDFIQQEEDEDEMARILEQIDMLRTNLESEGENLDSLQKVDYRSNKREARSVLRILQLKNDRTRYCDMFDEAILAGAYGLESLFDGQKEWFGMRIDLNGWSDTVAVKLKRMRYNTSSFVSDVMKGYQIGHGWRILLELLPSLVLYSRKRRLQTGDNLITDQSYRDAIRNLE